MKVRLASIREQLSDAEGFRVYVGHQWPEGVDRESTGVDLWEDALTPGEALSSWYDGDARKWLVFRAGYWHRLQENGKATELLKKLTKQEQIILLHDDDDAEHSAAAALKSFLNTD